MFFENAVEVLQCWVVSYYKWYTVSGGNRTVYECNTIKSTTSNISKWIDDQLQPLVQKLPSHLKDDNDFLCKLVELNNNHTLPPETILVTWDVKSLYTNIPFVGGMKACDYFMRLHNFANDKRETTIQFINLVLTCNNLKF